MQVTTKYLERAADLVALFDASFTASEGAEEGAVVSKLAAKLLENTEPEELRVFSAVEGETVAGAILFTRLWFEDDPRFAMLLSPVAVAPDRQRAGIGQSLIRAGLDALRAEGVDATFTYGDPGYYGRFGFGQITAQFAPPPHPLSYPNGWLAQSLTGATLAPFKGPSRCAKGFDDPAYW